MMLCAATTSENQKVLEAQEILPSQLIVVPQDTQAEGQFWHVPSLATGLVVVGFTRLPRVIAVGHFTLPDSKLLGESFSEQEPAKFIDLGIPHLLELIQKQQQGLTPEGPHSPVLFKLIGGSQLFQFGGGAGNPLNIGTRNAIASRATLGKLGKMVIAADVGGNKARKVTIEPASGIITVEEIGGRKITL
jgi:chemotaxis protein CheD